MISDRLIYNAAWVKVLLLSIYIKKITLPIKRKIVELQTQRQEIRKTFKEENKISRDKNIFVLLSQFHSLNFCD